MIKHALEILWLALLGMTPAILFFIAIIFYTKWRLKRKKGDVPLFVPITKGKPERE